MIPFIATLPLNRERSVLLRSERSRAHKFYDLVSEVATTGRREHCKIPTAPPCNKIGQICRREIRLARCQHYFKTRPVPFDRTGISHGPRSFQQVSVVSTPALRERYWRANPRKSALNRHRAQVRIETLELIEGQQAVTRTRRFGDHRGSF